jgi:hypothetical protein
VGIKRVARRVVRIMSPPSKIMRPSQLPRFPAFLRIFSCGLALLAGLSGCDPDDSSGAGGGGAAGSGGEGGMTSSTTGCLVVPEATFALRVLAADGGPVPPDTTIDVMWSAGKEPSFHLDQPETWGTLETANVVCDVDPAAPLPVDLLVLACDLWTSSPTEVRVSAEGYGAKKNTYMADPPTDDCNPEPTPIEIELMTAHQ